MMEEDVRSSSDVVELSKEFTFDSMRTQAQAMLCLATDLTEQLNADDWLVCGFSSSVVEDAYQAELAPGRIMGYCTELAVMFLLKIIFSEAVTTHTATSFTGHTRPTNSHQRHSPR